jgi:tetratricopeptide (TPR) repeat protein
MSIGLCHSLLIALCSFLPGNSPAIAQTSTTTPDAANVSRHQEPEWLVVEPHLPDPKTASAAQLETVGDVLRARRFPEDALVYYIYALRRGGPETELMNKLGVTELELKHTANARAYFQRVVHLERKDAQGWNNLGAAEYLDGRYGSAVSDYGKAIKLNKKSATFHSNLGTAYFEEKNFDRARKEFAIALALDPEMMEHCGVTGVEARMLSPEDHAHYLFEIARLYAHRGDETEMIRYLAMACEGGYDILHEMAGDDVMTHFRKDPRVLTAVQNARALRSGRASIDLPGGVPPLPPAPAAHE